MVKTKFCWWPVKLCARVKELNDWRIEPIGYVWWIRAQVVHNTYLGWITFTDYLNPPPVCKGCGRKLEVK